MQNNISNEEFKKCLGAFTTGVTIVTLIDASNCLQGITISSFSSLSLQPQMVSFNLGKASYLHNKILNSHSFAINILSSKQVAISKKFSEKSDNKFHNIDYSLGLHGCPLIRGTSAFIECHTDKIYDGGDHSIITGKIVNLKTNAAAKPLVYYMGEYYSLGEKII